MNIYLLDTNHLSPIVTIGHALRTKLLAGLAAGHNFAIASPVLFEFLFGIQTLARAEQNLQIWSEIKAEFSSRLSHKTFQEKNEAAPPQPSPKGGSRHGR